MTRDLIGSMLGGAAIGGACWMEWGVGWSIFGIALGAIGGAWTWWSL